MDYTALIAMSLLMGLATLLYASVGQAGASAYLAIMALFSVSPVVMRPTALVLNILVASIATVRFVRAEQFNEKLFLPLVIGAIPTSFVTGIVEVPGEIYRPLVALVLWCAAIPFLSPTLLRQSGPRPPSRWICIIAGAAIGCLSGLTGTGGGIFLSPVILFFGWETARKTSGIAAAFILCTSIAALAGNLSGVGELPRELPYFLVTVTIGAIVGTQLGISTLPTNRLLQVFSVVLIIAGAKMMFF